MAPSRRLVRHNRRRGPRRNLWRRGLDGEWWHPRRAALAVEAVVAVRRVWPPAVRCPPLLEKVVAGWCCAHGEAPHAGEHRGVAPPRWRRRVAGDAVESTVAVHGMVRR
jgi:hypothetical protein